MEIKEVSENTRDYHTHKGGGLRVDRSRGHKKSPGIRGFKKRWGLLFPAFKAMFVLVGVNFVV